MWSVVRRVDSRGRPELPRLSVYREHGVVLSNSRDDNYNKPGEDLATYLVVKPGQLVLNKMKTWQGSLAVSQHEGIVSPAYYVCDVADGVDGRFLHYLLRSQPYVAAYAAASKGVRPNQWDLPWAAFRQLPLALPDLVEQRRVSYFLDEQTDRLEAVLSRARRANELVDEATRAALSEAYGASPTADLLEGRTSESVISMRGLTTRMLGGGTPSTTEPSFWDDVDGVPWIAIGDMVDGGSTQSTVKSVTSAGLAAARLRVAPAGTLLFAMYASVGKTSVTGTASVWNQAILGLVVRRKSTATFSSDGLSWRARLYRRLRGALHRIT